MDIIIINQLRLQIELLKTVLADLQSTVKEAELELTNKEQTINDYRDLVTETIPILLSEEFGISSHLLPSKIYLEEACDELERLERKKQPK